VCNLGPQDLRQLSGLFYLLVAAVVLESMPDGENIATVIFEVPVTKDNYWYSLNSKEEVAKVPCMVEAPHLPRTTQTPVTATASAHRSYH